MDEQLAMFVVESHCRSHPSNVNAAAKTGGGSQDAEEDNTQLINDKVREMSLLLLCCCCCYCCCCCCCYCCCCSADADAASPATVGNPPGVRTDHTCFGGGALFMSCMAVVV